MTDMINEKRSFLEVDMKKLMLTFLSKWWLIAIGTILAMVLSYIYTIKFVTPMYRTGITVYVNSVRAGEEITQITNSTLATSQKLVNTYVNIIGSSTVLTKVAEASGYNTTPDEISRAMSATQVDDTEMFRVFITHKDAKWATDIANTIAEVAPGEIEYFVEGSSTKIIDKAKEPTSPSSPNVKKNCVLGGLIGAVLVLAYLTVRFLLDVRIKDEDELNSMFGIPVLGQIPAFKLEGGKRVSHGDSYATADKQQKGDAK